jgi:hypothetical protein
MVAALGICKDNGELDILKPREVASAGLDMVENASFKAGSVYEITKKLGIRRAFSSTENIKGQEDVSEQTASGSTYIRRLLEDERRKVS